jgi:hypothetical protein
MPYDGWAVFEMGPAAEEQAAADKAADAHGRISAVRRASDGWLDSLASSSERVSLAVFSWFQRPLSDYLPLPAPATTSRIPQKLDRNPWPDCERELP